MSSIAIQGNAAGAGVFTIASPNSASSYTATLPTQTGTLVSGTSTANAVIPAGTTAIAPMLLTSGTNLTTAVAGAIEYDGEVVYVTPQGTQRGVVPGAQFFRLNAALVGSNVNTAQNTLGVGVTLSASTVYAFEMVFALSKSAGTTSHTVGLGFGGTATLNNIAYRLNIQNPSSAGFTAVAVTDYQQFVQAASNGTVTGAQTSAALYISMRISGTVSVNAGGTFIPQYTLSAAPGGAYTTALGSYMMIYPISASGANTSVGAWA